MSKEFTYQMLEDYSQSLNAIALQKQGLFNNFHYIFLNFTYDPNNPGHYISYGRGDYALLPRLNRLETTATNVTFQGINLDIYAMKHPGNFTDLKDGKQLILPVKDTLTMQQFALKYGLTELLTFLKEKDKNRIRKNAEDFLLAINSNLTNEEVKAWFDLLEVKNYKAVMQKALIAAIQNKRPEVVKLLLKNLTPDDIKTIRDGNNLNIMHYVMSAGNLEILGMVYNTFPEIDKRRKINEMLQTLDGSNKLPGDLAANIEMLENLRTQGFLVSDAQYDRFRQDAIKKAAQFSKNKEGNRIPLVGAGMGLLFGGAVAWLAGGMPMITALKETSYATGEIIKAFNPTLFYAGLGVFIGVIVISTAIGFAVGMAGKNSENKTLAELENYANRLQNFRGEGTVKEIEAIKPKETEVPFYSLAPTKETKLNVGLPTPPLDNPPIYKQAKFYSELSQQQFQASAPPLVEVDSNPLPPSMREVNNPKNKSNEVLNKENQSQKNK